MLKLQPVFVAFEVAQKKLSQYCIIMAYDNVILLFHVLARAIIHIPIMRMN